MYLLKSSLLASKFNCASCFLMEGWFYYTLYVEICCKCYAATLSCEEFRVVGTLFVFHNFFFPEFGVCYVVAWVDLSYFTLWLFCVACMEFLSHYASSLLFLVSNSSCFIDNDNTFLEFQKEDEHIEYKVPQQSQQRAIS